MIIAGSGHRPQALGGYKIPNPIYRYVCAEIEKHLLELKPEKVISGGALGFDQWLAYVSHKLNIPFIAAIPFVGQEKAWPEQSQQVYNKLLKMASEVVIVSEGGYSAQKMQVRNQWMTDRCDILLACYNGDLSGGTFNCVQYAKKIGKEIIIINPNNASKE